MASSFYPFIATEAGKKKNVCIFCGLVNASVPNRDGVKGWGFPCDGVSLGSGFEPDVYMLADFQSTSRLDGLMQRGGSAHAPTSAS